MLTSREVNMCQLAWLSLVRGPLSFRSKAEGKEAFSLHG